MSVKVSGGKKPAEGKKTKTAKPEPKAPAVKKSAAKPAEAKAKAKPAKSAAAKTPAPAAVSAPAAPVTSAAAKVAAAVKRQPPKLAAKVQEEQSAFVNTSQDFAFQIAQERMRQEREAEQAKENSGVKIGRRPVTRGKGANSMQFPESDLNDFRKRLYDMRDSERTHSESLRTIALEQTEEIGTDDEDGSDAFLRLQSLSQVDSHNRQIQQIDEALRRIENGSYGICEVCGQLIRKPRLINTPFARTCIECQSKMEENPFGGR